MGDGLAELGQPSCDLGGVPVLELDAGLAGCGREPEQVDPFPTLHLEGLDPERVYTLHALRGAKVQEEVSAASGRYWMQHGLTPTLRGDFQGAMFTLTAR